MRALLGVYDKTGIEDFARGLVALGWEVVSTGGTFAALEKAGLPVRGLIRCDRVSEGAGQPTVDRVRAEQENAHAVRL